MGFWQNVALTAIPSVSAVTIALTTTADLRFRRKMEASRRFLDLFATAHGRPIDARQNVGVGEQVAAIHLIADFARKEALVREAAAAGLAYLSTWTSIEDKQPDGRATVGESAAVALRRMTR